MRIHILVVYFSTIICLILSEAIGEEIHPANAKKFNNEFFLIYKDRYKDFLTYCDGYSTPYDGVWNINEGDILMFERKFRRNWEVSNQSRIYGSDLDLNNYIRQYAGIRYKKDRFIFVMLTSIKTAPQLPIDLSEPSMLCDTSEQTFPLIYNLDKKIFVRRNFTR